VSFESLYHSRRSARLLSKFQFVILLSGIIVLAGCGAGNPSTSTTAPTTPSQPNYPSTPPVPITWSPSTSPLPAPPAVQPAGSNDFPLVISSPTDGATVTSPATLVASATPKNPIFFMRVFVDTLAVYFTFNSSINAQIWK
jgi:hypothetical protein